MRKVKKYWFTYTVLLLLITSSVFAWGILQKTRFDRSSRDIFAKIIEAVFIESNYSPLIDSAFNAQINDKPSEGYAVILTATKRTLGSLTEVSGIYGEATVPLVNFFGIPIIANYEADLQFASGPATLQITMQRHNDKWQTSRFLISSRQLLN